MACPNGSIGVQFKLCIPLSYAYAGDFFVSFAFRSRFTCIYVCGLILSHRFSGNKSSTPHKTDLKHFLDVCIPLSDKFLRCIPDGNNLYCI